MPRPGAIPLDEQPRRGSRFGAIPVDDQSPRWMAAPITEPKRRHKWEDAPIVESAAKPTDDLAAQSSPGLATAQPLDLDRLTELVADDKPDVTKPAEPEGGLPPWLVADPKAPGGFRGWTNAERLAAGRRDLDSMVVSGAFTKEQAAAERERIDTEEIEVAKLGQELGRDPTPFDLSLRRSVENRGVLRRSWAGRTIERGVTNVAGALGGMGATAVAEADGGALGLLVPAYKENIVEPLAAAAVDIRSGLRDQLQRAAAEQQAMDEAGSKPAAIASKATAMIGEVLGVTAGGTMPQNFLPYLIGNSVQNQLALADERGDVGPAKYATATAHGAIDAASYFLGGKVLGSGLQRLAGSQPAAGGATAVDLAVNWATKKYTLGPALQKLAKAAGEGGAQVVLDMGARASHYMTDVAAGNRKWNGREFYKELTTDLDVSAVTGAAAGAIDARLRDAAKDVVATIDRRQRDLPQALEGVAAAQEMVDAVRPRVKEKLETAEAAQTGGGPTGRGARGAKKFFETATAEQIESARRPMSQREFANVTGIKKTSEAFRESFRATLDLYAEAGLYGVGSQSKLSTHRDVSQFVDDAVAAKGKRLTFGFQPVTVDEAARLNAILPDYDFTGYSHWIDSDAVQHILRAHEKDALPVTPDDIKRIPKLIETADRVEDAGKTIQGLQGVRYVKRENGHTIYIESVLSDPDAKRLTATTFKKRKKAPDSPPPAYGRTVPAYEARRQDAGEPNATSSIEAPPALGETTSARQVNVDADRAALDLPELPEPERHSWRSALNEAEATGLPDQALARAHEINAADKAPILNDTETAGMTLKLAQLKNAHQANTEALANSTNDAASKYHAAELNRLEQEFDTVSTAVRRSGTEKGRALASQKLTVNQDYDLVSVVARAKAANSEIVTSEQRRRFAPLVNELEKIDRQIANHKGTLNQLDDLHFQQHKLRREIRERIDDLKPKTIWGRIQEPFHVSRALIASLDFSAVLRQGGFVTMGRPLLAAKAVPDMFKAAVNERAAFKINKDIHQRPNAPLYKDAKLYLHDDNASIAGREESYMSRWAERAVPGVAASQRAYTTFLNRLRADTFDTLVATLGKNGEVTKTEARVIANYVNVATGRGGLGAADQAMNGLSAIFFAPRYTLSRFQLLAGQPVMGGTARTRQLVAKEYARYLIGMGTVYGLAAAAGYDLNFDPRSSDFGKIKFGDTRLDPLSGLAQTARFTAQMVSGETVNKYGRVVPLRGPHAEGHEAAGVAGRFIRTKLSPAAGTITNLFFGEDVTGAPHNLSTGEGAANVAKNVIVPLSLRDIGAAIEAEGVPRGAAMGLASLFGVGLQTYDTANAETPEEFYQLQSGDLHRAIRQAESNIGQAFRADDATPEELAGAYQTFEARRRELFINAQQLYQGALKRGIPEHEALRALVDVGGRTWAGQVRNGRYVPYMPGDDALQEISRRPGGRARIYQLRALFQESRSDAADPR